MTTVHSPKAQTTLNGLGVAADAWEVTPIKWETQVRKVRTKIACPTCRGRGRVANRVAVGGKDMKKCPDCPARRNWPDHGNGIAYAMQDREVEVGVIQWPEGTRFDGRFGVGGCHCSLCGREVLKSPLVPFHGSDAEGQIHGMLVGMDCAQRMLGRTKYDAGTRDPQTGELVREVKKEKPAPKPEEGPVVAKANRHDMERAAREVLGDRLLNVSDYSTKKIAEYSFLIQEGEERRTLELKVSPRGGAILRDWLTDKALWRDREQFDALAALAPALAALSS